MKCPRCYSPTVQETQDIHFGNWDTGSWDTQQIEYECCSNPNCELSNVIAFAEHLEIINQRNYVGR